MSFFKQSGIERGVRNWRGTLDLYVEGLEEWDDVVGGRVKDRENMSEFIDPSFWLKEFSVMLNLGARIQHFMKEGYQYVYYFMEEFAPYLELQKRQELTNF